MPKCLIILIICFKVVFGLAQIDSMQEPVKTLNLSDTIYYDEKWIKCDKSSASFYRLVYVKDNGYLIKDYYISGVLQMSAKCRVLTSEVKLVCVNIITQTEN